MKDYLFAYEDVSVYACAMQLLGSALRPQHVHIDIGCGEGAIAQKIKDRGAIYIGFDINGEAVSRLRSNGFDAHEIDLREPHGAIGLIRRVTANRPICSLSMLDVIEHLPYDSTLLLELSRWMLAEHPEARLVTSIPNFSHADICVRLMAGRWDYTESGLLDRTHGNVLTEASIHRWFHESGWNDLSHNHYELTVSDQRAVAPVLYPANAESGIGRQLREIKKSIDPNHQVYQFVHLWAPGPVASRQPEAVFVTNFMFHAKDGCRRADAAAADQGIQVICVEEGGGPWEPWDAAVGEYVVFSRDESVVHHPMVAFVRATLEKNERPVLLIDTHARPDGVDVLGLDISPGPWVAVPTSALRRRFAGLSQRDLTPGCWQAFIVAAMMMCGVKVHDGAGRPDGEPAGIFPPLTLMDIAQRGELEGVVSGAWPHVDELRDWLCLPERLRIGVLEEELGALRSGVPVAEPRSGQILFDTNTMHGVKALALDEVRRDRDRIRRELEGANLRYAELYQNFRDYKKEIEASIGWKITMPLRWLAAIFKSR